MSHMPALDIPEGAVATPNTRAINTSGGLQGGGDLSADRTISIADSGVSTTKIADGAVTLAKIATIASATVLGSIAGGTPAALTATQVTALLDTFTSGLKGLVPASGGGTTAFLRADGSWVSPPGLASSLYYNVLDYDFVADGATDNRAALRALWAIVLAAGGGTIYFPPGDYYFAVGAAGDRDQLELSNTGACKIRFLGDGPSSRWLWGGDAETASAYFFDVAGNVSQIRFEKIAVMRDDLVNPDEQSGFLHLSTTSLGNIENISLVDCDIGAIPGDIVNCTGGQANTACHAAFAGTVAAGSIGGVFTNPANGPQRVVVKYNASWDGGSVTVTGTDANGYAISETLAAGDNESVIGSLEFSTVTSATKSATGVNAATASIGYAYMVRYITALNCRFDGTKYAGSAVKGYRGAFVAQRLSRNIVIRDCFVTGGTDQLIDFEPTSNGEVAMWSIEDNIFVTRGTTATNPPPGLAITLTGNNAQKGWLNEHCSFSRNVVWGRVQGLHLQGVRIRDNYVLVDYNTNPSATYGAIVISGLIKDVEIRGNHVWARPGFLGTPMSVAGANTVYPQSVEVIDNHLHWYAGSSGMKFEDCSNVICRGNTLYFEDTTTNTEDGIVFTTPNVTQTNIICDGNIIKGDSGGGTLRWGINFGGGAATVSASVTNNKGTGVATRGVSITASVATAFSPPMIVYGNQFPSATTPLYRGTNIPLQIAGNGTLPKIILYDASPEGAVAAEQGSLCVYTNTDSTKIYQKVTGTSSTGWQIMNGVLATGSITCTTKANYVDTDYMTIPDGAGVPKLYEFDTAGDGVTAGRVQVNISTDTTAAQVATRLKTAIEANQPLFSVTDLGTGTLTLTHKLVGAVGNVTITENVAHASHTVSGMSGGVNPAR